jgi:ADP-ribose pyrophosphatase YjhB (NUDIX family)
MPRKTPKPVVKKTAADDRHYPLRPVAGVGVVIWRDDKVLLVKRGNAPRQGEWGLPGGMQQLGETIMQAAVREAREETGLDIVPIGIVTAIDAITTDAAGKIEFHYTIVEVAADAMPGDAKAEDDAADLRWVALDEIDKLCVWPEVARIAKLAALQRVL